MQNDKGSVPDLLGGYTPACNGLPRHETEWPRLGARNAQRNARRCLYAKQRAVYRVFFRCRGNPLGVANEPHSCSARQSEDSLRR